MNLNSELTNPEAKIGSLLSQLNTQIDGLGNVVNYNQYVRTTRSLTRLVKYLSKYMNREKNIKKQYQIHMDDQDKEISKLNAKISDYYTQTEYERDVGIPVGNNKVRPKKRNMNGLAKDFTDTEASNSASAKSSESTLYASRLAEYTSKVASDNSAGQKRANSASSDNSNSGSSYSKVNTADEKPHVNPFANVGGSGDGTDADSSDADSDDPDADPFGVNTGVTSNLNDDNKRSNNNSDSSPIDADNGTTAQERMFKKIDDMTHYSGK